MGFFRKRSVTPIPLPAEPPVNSGWVQLVQRWDDYIAKIQQRAQVLLTAAVEQSTPLIAQTQFDTVALQQAWTGVQQTVIHDLYNKAASGWEALQAELEQKADIHYTSTDLKTEGQKLDALHDWLEIEYARSYVATTAQAAKKIISQASASETATQTTCPNCAATLALETKVFHAINLKCTYCGFVSTYEPSGAMRQIEGFAVQVLCDEAAFSAWENMKKLERQAKMQDQTASLGLLQAWEQATLTYWEKFYAERAKIMPVYADNTARDVAAKMEWFYKAANAFPQWRQRPLN